MRNYISALDSGNLFPHKEETDFLSNEGNLLPIKYISVNFYKEHRGLCSFAFENAQDGSNLTIVARNNFSSFVQSIAYNLIRNHVRALLLSIGFPNNIMHYGITNSKFL